MEANETLFVIDDLPVDANENDRNFIVQTERSCTSDVFDKKLQKCYTKSTLQPDIKEESFSCDIQKVQFYNENCLKEHCNSQTVKNRYSCDICKKEFSQLYILNHHLRTHSQEKPYSCDICRKQFSKKRSFVIHLRTQANENRHSCDVCNKKFCQKYYLNQHYLTHTNEKPYSCDVCSKQFFQKRCLNSHLRTHSNENLYSCDFCRKKFHQKSDLRKHYLTHTNEKPYSCDICHKGFSQQPYLNEHYRMHTNEKPFSCDVCGKDFSWRASFRVHLRTHLTVKPFSCDVCNKAFSQRCHLNRHLRTCRGKEADASSHRQFVIDVIQLYKELPCLWKVADPGYHDKKKRGRAMKKLIDLFKTKDKNANKKKVHRKITSMRGNYIKQSNKVKASLKSGTNANRVHIPQLWYYNLLTFLEDQNIEGPLESVLGNMPFGFDEDCAEEINESVISVPSVSRGAAMLPDSLQAQMMQKQSQSNSKQVSEKLPRRLVQPLEKQPAIKRKNKYDVFGEYVAEKLRSLQPNMVVYCQKLINDSIFLAEIGKLNFSSQIVTALSNSSDMNSVT